MYFQNIFYLYKKIWKFDKAYIVKGVLMIFVQAIHPFNHILFFKIIVDELTEGLRWSHVLVYVILLCINELILRSLEAVFWTYEQKKIARFKSIFLQEINLKTMTLSYQQTEDPELIDHRQKAMEIFYPRQARFIDLKNTIIDSKNLIVFALQFIGLIAILLTLKPYVFII